MSIAQSAEGVLNVWCKCGVHRRLLGRALEWHSRGQRFDPAYLHQIKLLQFKL